MFFEKTLHNFTNSRYCGPAFLFLRYHIVNICQPLLWAEVIGMANRETRHESIPRVNHAGMAQAEHCSAPSVTFYPLTFMASPLARTLIEHKFLTARATNRACHLVEMMSNISPSHVLKAAGYTRHAISAAVHSQRTRPTCIVLRSKTGDK